MKQTTYSSIFAILISLSLPSLANEPVSDPLPESYDLVKAGDKYITLMGNQVAVGDQAPQFKVVDEMFSPVSLSDFSNMPVLISVVPSLDTGVCSVQTKRFNEEAAKLGDNLTLLTISNDLPYAQKRFCKNENIEQLQVLSDSVWRDFGKKYGLLIKDMGLLTRAIFVIDATGKVTYKELVADISQHPDYDAALSALAAVKMADEKK
ncbi:thiol peroxidase [Thalassotalea sp. 1_MG-2023]|uniref:thiol peroxidase n=1 Tax=Thalassotalea sp. 1_MG-2023 TaxID=3062680 RepID=UPI0026E39BDF|nr:thiol peroxidase [Thalassotalea sp. 1_MG-2023]MDO6428429.1 thiol peroxidase [Thalassotalea sp. 1_MG-2023]